MAGSNTTEIVERSASWNWTASDKLAISVVEKLPAHLNGSIISESTALVHVCLYTLPLRSLWKEEIGKN